MEGALSFLVIVGFGLVFTYVLQRRSRTSESKPEPVKSPCPFCGEREYEHWKECPVPKIKLLQEENKKLQELLNLQIKLARNRDDMGGLFEEKIKNIVNTGIKAHTSLEKLSTLCSTTGATSGHVVFNDVGSSKLKFKIGQWVRDMADGKLGQIVEKSPVSCDYDPRWKVRFEYHKFGGCSHVAEQYLESALPRRGEWWTRKHCDEHSECCSNLGLACYKGSAIWTVDAEPNSWESQVVCGCLYPVYFGKGNP